VSSFSDEERAREWMLDILEYSERVATYLHGREYRDLERQAMLQDAVERCVAIITEAVIRLGPERLSVIAPDVPFHAVRNLGNMLRHAYRSIDPHLIWKTVTEDVPPLAEACRRALSGH
jgi:uncharacterized protein with HEPN domain